MLESLWLQTSIVNARFAAVTIDLHHERERLRQIREISLDLREPPLFVHPYKDPWPGLRFYIADGTVRKLRSDPDDLS